MCPVLSAGVHSKEEEDQIFCSLVLSIQWFHRGHFGPSTVAHVSHSLRHNPKLKLVLRVATANLTKIVN